MVHVAADVCFQFARVSHNDKCDLDDVKKLN